MSHRAFLEALFSQVTRFPTRTAYRCEGDGITYRALWERSGALAAQLLALQGETAAPVGVYGGKGSGMVVAFLACARAGRPYLPLEDGHPLPRTLELLRDSGAGLVLQVSDTAGGDTTLGENPFGVPVLEVEDWALEGEPVLAPVEEPGRPFYILYTSGSTGRPKGVIITGGNLWNLLLWSREFFPGGAQVYCNQAPFSFDLSVLPLYTALVTGGTLVDLPQGVGTDYPRLFENLRTSGATIWVSTPSFGALCLREPAFGAGLLPGLSTFLFCGERLEPGLVKKLEERFPRAVLYNSYGPTEATVLVTATRVHGGMDAPLPVGTLRPGSRVLVVDEGLRPLPQVDGAPTLTGELVIFGESVGAGYCSPAAENPFFQGTLDGVPLPAYRTGDWGYWKGGQLHCLGRRDSQVKFRGHRVELLEVEAVLRTVAGVLDAAVLYTEQPYPLLKAYLVLAEGKTPNGVKMALEGLLPPYMVPGRFVVLRELPLNANGKVDRKALEEKADGRGTL